MNLQNKLFCGDCKDVLEDFPEDSVDLIITSPPYANQRKKTYGGVSPSKYSDWFLPRAKEFFRVLDTTGTFILNIKERVKSGERLTYVLELILNLKKQGWLWTEEFIWAKTTSMPGWWPNRFRDGWERLLQFNKTKKFSMYQDAVMVTPNVLRLSPETQNKGHSAVFPVALPSWFIKVFTQPGDLVLDPFVGSGTTAVAAKNLGRFYIGIDQKKEYIDLAKKRIAEESC